MSTADFPTAPTQTNGLQARFLLPGTWVLQEEVGGGNTGRMEFVSF